ncbi:MAG: hypothetical protein E6356_14020 [Terrisporobacter othiniensis]|nr:hypothetical protein [Terrisporobacter othiniensis]
MRVEYIKTRLSKSNKPFVTIRNINSNIVVDISKEKFEQYKKLGLVITKINLLKSDMNCCEGCSANKGYCIRQSVIEPKIGVCWFDEEY